MRQFQCLTSAKIFSNKPGLTEKNMGLLKFPLLGSVKYDGWRVLEYGGRVRLRSMKPMKNRHVAAELERMYARAAQLGYKGLDGEVVVGAVNHPNAMQNTTSGLGSYDGAPEFTYLLFDSYQYADKPFTERYAELVVLHNLLREEFPWLVLVEQRLIHNIEQLLAYENEILELGFEGVMVRRPDGRYKLGRSTMLEGILMALKRFVDDEALILGYKPELENTNTATENELGHTARSSHQAGMVAKERMGTMVSASTRFEETFGLGGGTGVTHAMRQHVWDNPGDYQWRVGVYSYQDIGVKTRPRLPKWKAWRAWEDLDPEVAAALLALAERFGVPPGCRSALDPARRPVLPERVAA